MSKVFVFAYDEYYPSGGFDDLLAVLDDQDGQLCDGDFLLKPEVLVELLNRKNAVREHYQVVHFTADGGVLLVENWQRSNTRAAQSWAWLKEKPTWALEGDSLLVRTEVRTEFDDKSVCLTQST